MTVSSAIFHMCDIIAVVHDKMISLLDKHPKTTSGISLGERKDVDSGGMNMIEFLSRGRLIAEMAASDHDFVEMQTIKRVRSYLTDKCPWVTKINITADTDLSSPEKIEAFLAGERSRLKIPEWHEIEVIPEFAAPVPGRSAPELN